MFMWKYLLFYSLLFRIFFFGSVPRLFDFCSSLHDTENKHEHFNTVKYFISFKKERTILHDFTDKKI